MSVKAQAQSRIAPPSIDAFHEEMSVLCERHSISIKTLSDQSRLSPARIRAFLSGDELPTRIEFKRLGHALPQIGYIFRLDQFDDPSEPRRKSFSFEPENAEVQVQEAEVQAPESVAAEPAPPSPPVAPPTPESPPPSSESKRAHEEAVTSQTFGQTLREARVREGLSRLELAQMVGVTRTAVEYWENDKYPYRHNFLSLVQLFPALARFDSEIVKVRKSKEPLSLPTTEIVEAVKSPPPPVPEAQSDFIPNYIQIVALGEKLAEVQTGPSYNLILGALRQAKELQLDLDLLIELLESR